MTVLYNENPYITKDNLYIERCYWSCCLKTSWDLMIPLLKWYWNRHLESAHGPLARYVKLWVAHAPGMPGTFSPPQWVRDPAKHDGTCVMHVLWCMLGSLTSSFLWSWWRENIPGIPDTCATHTFTYSARGPRKYITEKYDYNIGLWNLNS